MHQNAFGGRAPPARSLWTANALPQTKLGKLFQILTIRAEKNPFVGRNEKTD